ncbi:hypothetical protein ACQPU1_09150 [Clostridium paraputrificum]|uniref:hypothetical protein n=1 Tax=Clostridium TaxID=1485 RepID=UPI003D34796B
MTYAIVYYLQEEHSSCGCGDHNHDHEHHHEVRSDAKLVGQIKELGPWACFMPDSYLVQTDLSADEVLVKLRATVEEKDLIFVTEANSKSTASSTPQVVEWIASKE